MEKRKIEYRFRFPADVTPKDACIERLITTLTSKSGVDSAHLFASASEKADVGCIHYDPSVVETADLRDAGISAGNRTVSVHG